MSSYWRKLFSSVQLNIHDVVETFAVVPVYYGHLKAIDKCPDYPGKYIYMLEHNLEP